MSLDFAVEKTREGTELRRENTEHLNLSFAEGLCAADITDTNRQRDRGWFIENIINPLIRNGKITPRDRKFRYDYSTIQGNTLEVALGVTHFYAYKEDMDRNHEQNERLQELGVQIFGNQYAFFSRVPGISATIITSDGSVFLGERSNEIYTNLLCGVAGHLSYKDDINKINLKEDLEREIEEEFKVKPNITKNARFVGIYSHPDTGDMDFTYLVCVDQPDEYFKSIVLVEHKPLIQIPTLADVRQLLQEGKISSSDRMYKLMYSTRGALESIRAGEMNN